MSIISIRLSDELLHDLDIYAKALHVSRTQYIKKAIEQMNQAVFNQSRKQRLQQASLCVRKESMRVNEEFSRIERDPED